MKQNDWIIDINALKEGTYEYEFHLEDAFFAAQETTEVQGGSLNAKAQLSLNKWGGVLHLAVEGVVTVTCDRCLDPMEEHVSAEENLQVKFSATATNDEDVCVDPQDGELDLGWLFYELITINLPIVHRHHAGECNPQMEELLQTHLCTEEDVAE
ncbi:MAG: YceD family protein [Paludibacteraceae bacterium]